jgi:hypothetical protein
MFSFWKDHNELYVELCVRTQLLLWSNAKMKTKAELTLYHLHLSFDSSYQKTIIFVFYAKFI